MTEAAATEPRTPVRLEFYEPVGKEDPASSPAPELRLVEASSLHAPGDFEETVSMQGGTLLVLGIIDADGNGACTDGESWGRAVVTVGSDDTASATVDVSPETHCMPMSTPE